MFTLHEHCEVDPRDDLIIGTVPPALTGAKIIRKLGTKATLKRGTLLAKDPADGKLVVYGTGGTAGTFSATGDGTTTVFSLIDDDVIPVSVTEVKVDGTALTTGWEYSAATGNLTFSSAPANTKAIAVKTVTTAPAADAILCRDTEVGTANDAVAMCYLSGMFNAAKIVIAEDAEITDAALDALRTKDIFLRNAQEAL